MTSQNQVFPDYEDLYPERRMRQQNKLPAWLIVMLVLGALAAGLVLLVFLYIWTAKELPVGERERQVVLCAEELLIEEEDPPVDPKLETITKRRYIDGSHEIEYEYGAESDDAPIYLYCCVSIENSEEDARSVYGADTVFTHIGMRLGSDQVTHEKRDDIFRYGDQSSFAVIKAGGEPVGNLFSSRIGTKVFSVTIVGVIFDDGEIFGEVIGPHLEALRAYDPAK